MPMIPKQSAALWRAFRCGRSAGPIVEFALVVPMLLMIVMGVVDFGRAYFIRNSLVSAVREGARLGAVQSVDPCSAASMTAIRARVVASFSSIGSTAISNTVTMIPITCELESGRTATVRVQVVGYPFQPITPLFGMLQLGASFPLTASARFRWELAA
jgi:Flp pilus assembly protein TadG